MEFLQLSAPAIRDIGIYDLQEWGGGFNELYRRIFDTLFDENRKLNSFMYPILKELNANSVCSADAELLAAALSRVAAIYGFASISMDRHPHS
jgi:hypothetical protein